MAHCLGITSPDPIRLNLYFERFLNPARATPPDIDTDLCSRRRDEVIRFVYQRFGEDRVATVCTINRFRSRSALREVAKAYGLPAEEVSRAGRQPAVPLVRSIQTEEAARRSFCRAKRALPYPNPPGNLQRCSCVDRLATPPVRPPRRSGDQPGTH